MKDFLTRVTARFPLESGIIFGSRARSDELQDSDYDLILISPAFEGMTWRERIGATLELWNLDVDLEVLCYTPEEFRSKAAEISTVAEAVREGLLVWGDSGEHPVDRVFGLLRLPKRADTLLDEMRGPRPRRP